MSDRPVRPRRVIWIDHYRSARPPEPDPVYTARLVGLEKLAVLNTRHPLLDHYRMCRSYSDPVVRAGVYGLRGKTKQGCYLLVHLLDTDDTTVFTQIRGLLSQQKLVPGTIRMSTDPKTRSRDLDKWKSAILANSYSGR